MPEFLGPISAALDRIRPIWGEIEIDQFWARSSEIGPSQAKPWLTPIRRFPAAATFRRGRSKLDQIMPHAGLFRSMSAHLGPSSTKLGAISADVGPDQCERIRPEFGGSDLAKFCRVRLQLAPSWTTISTRKVGSTRRPTPVMSARCWWEIRSVEHASAPRQWRASGRCCGPPVAQRRQPHLHSFSQGASACLSQTSSPGLLPASVGQAKARNGKLLRSPGSRTGPAKKNAITLRCSSRVPELVPCGFLGCRPVFAQIGPNAVGPKSASLARDWPVSTKIGPKHRQLCV